MKTKLLIASILLFVLGFSHTLLGQSAPDFTLKANPAAVQMPAGGSTQSRISSSALNGFNGSLQLACQNLPEAMTCTFTPVDLQLGQGEEVSSQLIISAVEPKLTKRAGIVPDSGKWIMSVLLILMLGGACTSRSRNAAGIAAILVLLPCLTLLGGCQGLQTTHPNGHTYNMLVTATALDGTSQSVPMSVTVLQ